jgi:hypothetical protein
VWCQNARAKYRRNVLKQEDKGSVGSGPLDSGNQSMNGDKLGDSPSLDDDELEMDMSAGSPAMSDISSSPSLSDLQSGPLEPDHDQSSSSLSELFSNTINSIN